jgi:hypothetical protein
MVLPRNGTAKWYSPEALRQFSTSVLHVRSIARQLPTFSANVLPDSYDLLLYGVILTSGISSSLPRARRIVDEFRLSGLLLNFVRQLLSQVVDFIPAAL